MPPLALEGHTLGEKRRHYNKLVEDALATKHYELRNISADDSDIDNLLKIDIACKTKNIDYIIEVIKSNDMLYAATAIKKSTWLITEQQYANIINPEYLHTQLLPSMNTRTFNKLMLHIRLNLKDEIRVETFYEYLKQSDSAYKWLQNCSIPFIENIIKNERLIPLSLFKRLCRRSAHFIAYYTRVTPGGIYASKDGVLMLLKSHTADVLNILEHDNNCAHIPMMGRKKTEVVMKKCPQKVFDNFDKYVYILDLSVVTKYINKKEIITFLYQQVKTITYFLRHARILKHFVKNMPEKERLQFIKQTFIDQTDSTFVSNSTVDRSDFDVSMDFYYWFEYAPFNVAFTEIAKRTHRESSPSVRCSMLSVLIPCARRNQQHIKQLIFFFFERHINEPLKFKIQFVNNLLSQISTHELDEETWNILDKLFHSMEVYTKSENNVQICLQSIVLYKVLHDELVPEIVEQKMIFNTFEKIQRKLTQEQNTKLFTYLLNSVLKKVQIENVSRESVLAETIVQLKNALTLLKDWKKDINKFVLKKILELNNIKRKNTWKTDMSCLYNVKKSWRKHMFEESLSMCLNEEACLNALKHKPQLLSHLDKQMDTLRTDDAVSLPRLLAKLRVYWPYSLAQHWADAYLLNLNKPTGQKAAVKGLCMLLPQNQIIDLARKYAPNDFQIKWGETDQADINIRKSIAQHLHLTRPLVPLDTVLWYSQGDYLQYAVPSLNAYFSKLSEFEGRLLVPKLLEEPVSLQKFGLHLVFLKLKPGELKTIFSEIWNTTKNLTIRIIIFKHTFVYMCKVKNANVVKELWDLLSMFISKISSDEHRGIYKCLSKVDNVPISVRAEFYMAIYGFWTLPASANNEKYVKHLIDYAPKIMGLLEEDFVVNELLSPIETKFCSYESEFVEVFASYVLWGRTEEEQLQRFRKVVGPAMKHAFLIWNNSREDRIRGIHYYVKDNFRQFIRALMWNFKKYVTLNKIPIPAKLFVEIKTKMEENMPLLENYVLYTSWKLITEYVQLMVDYKISSAFELSQFSETDIVDRWLPIEMEEVWQDFHSKISPPLGLIIVKCLKEDTERHIPLIWWMFADAFYNMFDELFFQGLGIRYPLVLLETLKHMLDDRDFIPSYLFVCKATSKVQIDEQVKKIRSDIRKQIISHPSQEVQTHYHNEFMGFQDDEVNM